MSIHDEIQELLPAYALGALDVQEAARAEDHLASCDICSRFLDEYRPVASALALTVPMAQPSRDLKDRTMRRVLSGSATSRTREVPPSSLPYIRRSWFAPAFAGVALLIAIITLGYNAWQTGRLGSQVQEQRNLMTVVAYAQGAARVVRGTSKAPNAVGRLYLDLDSPVAALVSVNMPPLAEDRVYQVWLTDSEGSKVSGGSFRLDPEGNGLILLRAPRHFDAYIQVGVTDEPAGGSSSPTTEPVLLAKFASP